MILISFSKTFPFLNLSTNDKTDLDIIRSEHRFLWDEEEDIPDETW